MRRLRSVIAALGLCALAADPGFADHGDFGTYRGDGQNADPSENVVMFTPPPFTAIYPGSLGQAYNTLQRYYEAHASERAGRCRAPYVDGITNTQVVENTSERLVVDVRYLYRDRFHEDAPTSCIGYGTRRFVLARNSHGLNVQEMSGPVRN